jgi:hypothetical protein
LTAIITETSAGTDPRAGCPDWCVGGCDESTADENIHSTESEDVSDYTAGPGWHALTRIVQDLGEDSRPAIELALMDQDGGDAAIRISPDLAAEFARAILANVAEAGA